VIRRRPETRGWGVTTAALALELLILLVGDRAPWARSYLGDTLAVVLVFSLLWNVFRLPYRTLIAMAFGTAIAVELIQLLLVRIDRVVEPGALRLLVGTSPDPADLLAYALGAAACAPLGSLLEKSSREGPSTAPGPEGRRT
jgi:hypothetical protein